MNRSIQTTASPAAQRRTDFYQAILGKYGMTRWRSRFQNLILRQYPLLFAEPEAVRPAGTVINNIQPVNHTHIHHSTSYPVTQVMTVPGTVIRRLHITQISRGAETVILSALQRNLDVGKGESHSAGGSPSLLYVLQDKVRKQQNHKHPITMAYRTIDSSERAVEPVTGQDAVRNLERTAAPPWTYLPPMQAVSADKRVIAERRTGSGLMPYSRESRQRESITRKTSQDMPAARHQLQTLRTYTLYKKSADTVNLEQPVRQKPEPAEVRYDQAEPSTMALKSNREAVSGSAGTTVEAQLSTPSLIFSPTPGSQPILSPGLQLGLGHKLTAALEKLESKPELRNRLLAKPAAVHQRLQQSSMRPILTFAVPSEALPWVQRNDSVRLSSAARPVNTVGQDSVETRPGLFYTAKRQGLPSALQGIGPEQEHHQPAGRTSSLILRKPEAPKAAQPEHVQQQQPIHPEPAALLPSQSFPKAAAPVVKMDTAELNQLAERVYQVLEKKMAIRKDRRGLR